MSKYSYEGRLETVQGQVQRWVNRYEKYGPEGLLLHDDTYTGEYR